MRLKRFAPAFGHVIENPKEAIASTLANFNKVDLEILDALNKGAKTPEEIVSENYPKITDPEDVVEIAKSVEVHLAKLADEKSVKHLKAGWKVR